MNNVIPHNLVLKLEKTLPDRGKIILAERLKVHPSYIYMMFAGKRKMRQTHFDEALVIIDEWNGITKKINKELQKREKNK